MKWNLRPWQIGLICATGAVVIGGAGTGIWYGVAHAGNTAEEDTTPAVIESVQDAEPALDSTEPTSAVETGTEPEAQSEPKTNGDTTKEPSKETESVPTTPQIDEITASYDANLSKEVSKLIGGKFPEAVYDEGLSRAGDLGPLNWVHGQRINADNDKDLYVGPVNELTAEAIVQAWTNCNPLYFG